MQPEIVFCTALPGPYPGDPQPVGAKDYRALLGPKGGWTRLLKDRTCLVLCPPWGVWAPYVRMIEPENWSPLAEGMPPDMTFLEYLRDHHEIQDLDPDGVGAFGEVDPGLIFQKELWDWAAKPTSTTVIVIPVPGPELPHRTAVGFAGQALLNHLIPNLGFRPSTERVERDDLRDVEDEHRPWVKALGSMWAGSAFESGEYSADAFLDGFRLEDVADNFENSRFLLDQKSLPLPPESPDQKVSKLRLLAHPRGDDDLGVAVHGRVGEGHLVVVMAVHPKNAEQVDRLRTASLALHELLHLDGQASGGARTSSAQDGALAATEDPGATISLEKVAADFSRYEIEFEGEWDPEKLRSRMRRAKEGKFARLAAMRTSGTRPKIRLGPYLALLPSLIAEHEKEVENVKRTEAAETRLRKTEGRPHNTDV